MKKIWFVIIPVLALAACSSVQKSTRVSTPLQAQEYNSVASRYMERPTSVILETFGNGKDVLMVEMKTYGVPKGYSTRGLSSDSTDLLKRSQIRFVKEQVSGYLSAIDKFLEWAALASERNDAFTKDINSLPGFRSNVSLKFQFHSGNDHAHYLVIMMYSLGIPMEDQAQYYDVAGAKELKRLLLAFASDSIQRTDIESVYR